MDGNLYESCALVLRYVFAVMGLFIVLRAGYMTLVDGRRAKSIRSSEADTGIVAHLSVSGEKGRSEKISLYKEGVVGAGRGADIRIGGAGLEKRHFYYEIVDGGIEITPLDGATVKVDGEEIGDFVCFRPGGVFTAGRVQMKYVVNRIPVKPISPTTRRMYGSIIGKVMEKK